MSLLLTTGAPGSTAAVNAQAAVAPSLETVAKNALGKARSGFSGTTASGDSVTGTFTPLGFTNRNGNLRARGIVTGVVHQAGPNTTFTAIRTVRVLTANGTDVSNARAAAVCQILRLRLGPIRLNLLGLRIRTNVIRVRIVAVPGPGNLLGNLLCAIAGLLDPPTTPAQLAEVTTLLQRVLNRLNLGV
jgi:hypothetical protein